MNIILGLGLFVIGAVLTVIGAATARLLYKLTVRGPTAADEAFERGDTLRAWWNASQMPTTLDSPRDNERLAFGARPQGTDGEVLVEERASYPGFAR